MDYKKFLTLALCLCMSSFGSHAKAETSANIGLVSDYFYRGIDQNSGATASFGLDYEQSGFYAGTWFADVIDGVEYDVFAGYGWEFNDNFSLSVGFTGYFYTGDTFDDTYSEANLNAGFGMLSIEYSAGTHDLLGGVGDEDYTFTAATLEGEHFYGTAGSFGDDFEGSYVEFGYNTEISDLDVGVAIIFGDDELSNQLDLNGNANDDTSIVFSISKTFDM